jgi:hypothetical protein
LVILPDYADEDPTNLWRLKYEGAYRRYSENPTAENCEACTKALRILAALMLEDRSPPEE